MEKEDFIEKELKKDGLKESRAIRNLLIVNIAVTTLLGCTILFCSYINFAAVEIAETKVDFRYFNLTKSLTTISKKWIDTYDGAAYNTESEYLIAVAKHPEYKKRTFLQKYFNRLSKGR